jgi:SagB-type dehydrogenase family enzyme
MLRNLVTLCLSLIAVVPPLACQEPPTLILPPVDLGRCGLLSDAIQHRRSTREFSDVPLSRQELSNILWCAGGINRPANGLRTVPSAMNRHDIDIYAFLRDGVYRYDAGAHALRLIVAGDFRRFAGTQEFVASAPLNLVYISDFARLSFTDKEEEKISMAGVEAGHASQNVYLYGAAAHLGVVVRAYIDKPAVEKLLKLTPGYHIVIAQTVGHLRSGR